METVRHISRVFRLWKTSTSGWRGFVFGPVRLGVVLSMSLAGTLILGGACTEAAPRGKGPKKPSGDTPNVTAPVRIAQTHTGDLLVSEADLGMVLTVDDRTLQVKSAFTVPGRPVGVAYAKGGGGLIFVGNETQRRVAVYDKSGVWQYNLGDRDDYTWQPTDIAVDEQHEFVFVVDTRRRVVKMYSTAGLLLRSFPATAPDPAVLAAPTGIAVDAARQEVYVSDYGDDNLFISARIQVFGYNGALLRTITGKLGMLGVRFARPQGLAVDAGTVFVVECVSGEVLAYDALTGVGLKVLGTYGAGAGELDFPLDVVVDSGTKDVFVTNKRSGRIERFVEGGVLP